MTSVKTKAISASNAALDCFYGVSGAGVKTFSCANSYASIFSKGDTNYLTFRSSDDWKDWAENLLALPLRRHSFEVPEISEPYRYEAGILVHYGFYQGYERLRGQVNKAIVEMDSPITNWVIVGHSLGGAMAGMSVMDFPLDKRPDLITFGAPRWGNAHANWLVNQRSDLNLRFVCGADVVPRIPQFCWRHSSPAVSLKGTNLFWKDHDIETYRAGL